MSTVGVGQRDQRVRTPQLHGGLLEVLARTRSDDGPSALAAGQRHSAHPRVVDEQRELILGGEQVGVGALWATGFQQQLLEGGRGLGHVGGVFDHHHVAGHEIGCGHPRQLVIGKVPRLDPQDHSQWGADHHGIVIGARGLKTFGRQEGLGVLGVVLENLRAELDLTQALGVELAHLEGEQPGELVQAFAKDGGGTPAYRRALAKRFLAP